MNKITKNKIVVSCKRIVRTSLYTDIRRNRSVRQRTRRNDHGNFKSRKSGKILRKRRKSCESSRKAFTLAAKISPVEAPYEVMDPVIGEALEELSFVNKIYTYHQAFNPDAESDYGYYPESVSRLRLDGRLREVLEQEHAQVGETIETSSHLYREGEDVDLGVLGIDAEAGDESHKKSRKSRSTRSSQNISIRRYSFHPNMQPAHRIRSERPENAARSFVSIIFGLIGLVNIVNTLVTDVLARKIEFASLQSIGMIGRQMRRLKALLQRSEKKIRLCIRRQVCVTILRPEF